jgi:hypothetical protein
MPNYWVVGAMLGGHDDQYDIFIRRGYRFLGWSNQQQPAQAALRDQIQPGDRIAIKRMLGKGSSNIEIRAIGIVEEIDPSDKRIYIRWAASGLQREVPANGYFASIHGPIKDDVWKKIAFQL